MTKEVVDKSDFINQTMTGKRIMDQMAKPEVPALVMASGKPKQAVSCVAYLNEIKAEPTLESLRLDPLTYLSMRR